MTIAGHTFVDGPDGRQCHCGVVWHEISGADDQCVGKTGYQCGGIGLTSVGLAEIEAEKDRLWARAMGSSF